MSYSFNNRYDTFICIPRVRLSWLRLVGWTLKALFMLKIVVWSQSLSGGWAELRPRRPWRLLRLSHKDNAVTTQGSYQCGIHTFSSKMAAHEILKDLRRVKPVLSTELVDWLKESIKMSRSTAVMIPSSTHHHILPYITRYHQILPYWAKFQRDHKV